MTADKEEFGWRVAVFPDGKNMWRAHSELLDKEKDIWIRQRAIRYEEEGRWVEYLFFTEQSAKRAGKRWLKKKRKEVANQEKAKTYVQYVY